MSIYLCISKYVYIYIYIYIWTQAEIQALRHLVLTRWVTEALAIRLATALLSKLDLGVDTKHVNLQVCLRECSLHFVPTV